jgi:hypothetical protein
LTSVTGVQTCALPICHGWGSICPGRSYQHNDLHCRVQENPHDVAECHFKHRVLINEWCGVVGKNIIGPNVIEEPLTAPCYRNFLKKDLPLCLEDVRLETQRQIWLQHGGPPHFGRALT